jgi:uncharacterized protein
VIVVDANVLLYAYNAGSPEHERCRTWLDEALAGPSPVAFTWLTILAFLRLATSPRIFQQPLTMAEAVAHVSRWLVVPTAVLLEAGPMHWELLKSTLLEAQAAGNLVTDGAIAALALENGAAVCTTDRDFRRFTGLRLIDPLAA